VSHSIPLLNFKNPNMEYSAGDSIDGALAFLLFLRCRKVECKLDTTTQFMMLLNILLDFVVGLVPIIGDLADAAIRANSKNVRLLEKRLDAVYKPEALKKRDRNSNIPPATVFEDFSDDDSEKLPTHRQDVEPARPDPVRIPTETRGGDQPDRKGTLQKSGSKKQRDNDVVYAHPDTVNAQPGRSNTKKSNR
jgi:hypothetical protein